MKEGIVSSAERFVRHHKRQTDCAIGEAYSRLAADSLASAAFTKLLSCVRKRAARLLAAPVVDGRHPGVEALVNLSRFVGAHVRPVEQWRGCETRWQGAIASLAQHLVGTYRVPVFLAAAWYATDEAYAETKRRWFVAHAAGARFRSLDVPIRMTRKMEEIFLQSHDHLAIEYALRRAELLGLGVPHALTQAVLATRVAADLRHGEFWRTVWLFLVANARACEPSHVGPIVDFLQAVRCDRVAMETPQGTVMREPPQPDFSMKGRTLRSILRLMQNWHHGLGIVSGGLRWEASRLRPMMVEEPSEDPCAPPVTWQLTELTDGAQLRAEGTALRHCVGSYADRCWRGTSQIWSLRRRRGERVKHILTVEVDLKKRAVTQARGWRNRPASARALRLLQAWSARENLRLNV